jgi:phosphoribosyl 1,2-cyclic phosphodiesterase
MTLRFCNLGSGSSGNATLVEQREPGARTTRVLVDCGLSLRDLTRRLAARGVAPHQIDAVFITHEHSDHIGCARRLAARHGVCIVTSAGTWRAVGGDGEPPIVARAGEPVVIGGLELRPFAVPHDAAEPLQLTLGDGARRLGVVTDLGAPDAAVSVALAGCAALLLECNHDAQMLAEGPYPLFLKRRIGGGRGHLANAQSAALLRACLHAGLRHVVAAHLSLANNRPALAAAALAQALGAHADEMLVADPHAGSPWLDLN